MMFYSSIGAMSRNRLIVDSLAAAMGWSAVQAEATLNAYATGLFLPTQAEVKAISNLKSFHDEWRLALYAFHVLELLQKGVDLSPIASHDTVSKWVRGVSVISQKKRGEILQMFNVDVDHVPESRRFAYAETQTPTVSIDLRRNHLKLSATTYFLAQTSDSSFVVKFENRTDLACFHQNVIDHGLTIVDSGDFNRAVIPASEARVYYAKS